MGLDRCDGLDACSVKRNPLKLVALLSALWCPALLAAEAAWPALRDRLEAGDTSVDFRALRLAFATSAAYQADTPALREMQEHVSRALAKDDFAGADKAATAWLAVEYVNPFAHLGAARAQDALGAPAAAAFHRKVAEGLMDSLCQRGEGQSPDAPCVAISVAEVYAYLARRRLEPGASHEAQCKGGVACLVFEVREQDSGNLLDLYFDISRPLAARR
ncbi:MAG: hypothetical protein RL434_2878 [Pseudomonadota bacterium]|jgi:hypothetical protein